MYYLCIIIECFYRCVNIFQLYIVGMMAECYIGIFNRIGPECLSSVMSLKMTNYL